MGFRCSFSSNIHLSPVHGFSTFHIPLFPISLPDCVSLISLNSFRYLPKLSVVYYSQPGGAIAGEEIYGTWVFSREVDGTGACAHSVQGAGILPMAPACIDSEVVIIFPELCRDPVGPRRGILVLVPSPRKLLSFPRPYSIAVNRPR